MPLSVQEKFDKAVKYVRDLPKDGPYQPSQEVKLQYYAYFKQATEGDVNTARPGLLDFVGKAKWDAWAAVKGTSEEKAKQTYVALLVKDLENPKLQSDEVTALLEQLKE